MSKRVLIMLGIGILLIIGSLFLMKHEVKQAYADSQEPEEEPEEELKQEPQPKADEKAGETTN